MPDPTDSSGGGGPEGSPGLDSADTFALLGDATRLEIVTTLHDSSLSPPVAFSALYERIDIRDTAQFNYHLDKLVPHFVSKSDDGYGLTARGRRVARAITAGIYTGGPQLDPFEIDGVCYACGAAALWASYEDERFRIECRECDEPVLSISVPPSVARGREPGAFVAAVDRWSWSGVEQASRGVCPTCGGAIEAGVDENARSTTSEGDGEVDERPIDAFEALATFECDVCGRRAVTSFGAVAYRHPPVEAFHRRRGVSLRTRPYWEIGQYVAHEHVEVVSRDPWLVRVSFFADGDACHVEVDGGLDVVRTEIVADERPGDD